MLGLFNFFGRSDSLKALDLALRAAGAHPATVPEAVKLAIVRLLKDAHGTTARLPDAAYAQAAQMLAYCMLGSGAFAADNGSDLATEIDARLEAAVEEGTGLDASVILLALHAGLISAEVADRFDVETG